MHDSQRQSTSFCLSLFAVFAGVVGMAHSCRFLASASVADNSAGAAILVAGTIQMGAGILALAVLAQPRYRPEATRTQSGASVQASAPIAAVQTG